MRAGASAGIPRDVAPLPAFRSAPLCWAPGTLLGAAHSTAAAPRGFPLATPLMAWRRLLRGGEPAVEAVSWERAPPEKKGVWWLTAAF